MRKITLWASMLCIGMQLQAEDFYVTPAGAGDGTSWATPTTLQLALNQSAEGDVIRLAKGVYVPTVITGEGITDERAKTFYITKSVTLEAGYSENPTATEQPNTKVNKATLSGVLNTAPMTKAYHLLCVNTSTTVGEGEAATDVPSKVPVVLKGLILTGSAADTDGANGTQIPAGFPVNRGSAIFSVLTNVELTDCEITGNEAGGNKYGGQTLYFHQSDGKFTDCKLTKNTTSAGLLLFFWSSTASFNGCLFSENSNSDGGAIAIGKNSTASFSKCEFSTNSCENRAGALFAKDNATVSISECSFAQNFATSGGALYAQGKSNITIDKSTFTENASTKQGGAIYATTSGIELTNSTFTKNDAATNEGGAFWGTVMTKKCVVDNCQFIENVAKHGGAFQTWDKNEVMMSNCLFKANKATSDGGALFFKKNAIVDLFNCQFLNNEGNTASALRVQEGSTVMMKSCVMDGNVGKSWGTTILVQGIASKKESTWVEMYDCAVKNSVYAGTINPLNICAKNSIVTMYNSLISNLKVADGINDKWGIAVGSCGGILNLVNTTVTGCKGGSLIYGDDKGFINVISSTLVDNFSAGDNSVIHFDTTNSKETAPSSTSNYLNSIISNADFAGGATVLQSATLTQKNTVVGNKVFDATGAETALVFNRATMLDAALADNGSSATQTFKTLEVTPNYAVSEGMNATELSALAEELTLLEDQLMVDQRGAARKGKYMGAYTAGQPTGIDNPLATPETACKIYANGNSIIIYSADEAMAEVYTISGMRILNRAINAGENVISGISQKGIYLVRVNNQVVRVAL